MFTVFPKRWFGRDLATTCALIAELGFDGIDLAVRGPAWVQAEDLASSGPAFLRCAKAAGLAVPLAIVDVGIADLLADDRLLAGLADCGIPMVRIGYLRGDGRHPGAILDAARSQAVALAEKAERRGIRIVYQVHHGTLVSSPTAAWHIARDADPRWFAVQLDAGNQIHEGFEAWNKAVSLLGAHCCALGVKDARWQRDENGHWRAVFVPVGEGQCDWQACCAALGPDRLYDFQPFHQGDPDPNEERTVLRQEIQRIRQWLEEAHHATI